jgi:hypothetical protein
VHEALERAARAGLARQLDDLARALDVDPARLVERQREADRRRAMHDRRHGARDPLALQRGDAQPGRLQVGRDGAHAAAVRPCAGCHDRLEQLVDARLGGRVVVGAHERHDVEVGLLEHAREQLHADEPGGPRHEQRSVSAGHAASRHRDALWPPNPNEFDSATGWRPSLRFSAVAVPGT